MIAPSGAYNAKICPVDVTSFDITNIILNVSCSHKCFFKYNLKCHEEHHLKCHFKCFCKYNLRRHFKFQNVI